MGPQGSQVETVQLQVFGNRVCTFAVEQGGPTRLLPDRPAAGSNKACRSVVSIKREPPMF